MLADHLVAWAGWWVAMAEWVRRPLCGEHWRGPSVVGGQFFNHLVAWATTLLVRIPLGVGVGLPSWYTGNNSTGLNTEEGGGEGTPERRSSIHLDPLKHSSTPCRAAKRL